MQTLLAPSMLLACCGVWRGCILLAYSCLAVAVSLPRPRCYDSVRLLSCCVLRVCVCLYSEYCAVWPGCALLACLCLAAVASS
eukprot:1997995-Prymnesium_polylepis.1